MLLKTPQQMPFSEKFSKKFIYICEIHAFEYLINLQLRTFPQYKILKRYLNVKNLCQFANDCLRFYFRRSSNEYWLCLLISTEFI